MAFQPMTFIWSEFVGNEWRPYTLIVSETEIYRTYTNCGERTLMFKVDTPFTFDELANGMFYKGMKDNAAMYGTVLYDSIDQLSGKGGGFSGAGWSIQSNAQSNHIKL